MADQLDQIATKLGRQFPAAEVTLKEAATDICAFAITLAEVRAHAADV